MIQREPTKILSNAETQKPTLATLIEDGSKVESGDTVFTLRKDEFNRLVDLYEQRRKMCLTLKVLTQGDIRAIVSNEDLINACPYGIKIESYPQRRRTKVFDI